MAKNSKENPRMSIQQKAVLIEFLETHPNLVTGQLCKGFSAEDKSRLWSEITVILNDLGVNKGVSEWKGSWKDLKRTVKNKAAKIRETQKLNGTARITPLTDLEERVIALIANNTLNGVGTSAQSTQEAFVNAVQQTQENDGNLSRDEYSQEGVPFHLAPEVQMYPHVLEQPTPSGHMTVPQNNHSQMYAAPSAAPDNHPQIDNRYKIPVHQAPVHLIAANRKRGRLQDEDPEHHVTPSGIAMTMLNEQSQAMARLTAVLERQANVQEEMLALKKQRMATQNMKTDEEMTIKKQKMTLEQRKASAMEQIMVACLEYTKTH